MALIDKRKEEIGWLKVLFAILIATDISLIAWLIQNFGKTHPFLYLAAAFGAILIMFAIDQIHSVARLKINELEEL